MKRERIVITKMDVIEAVVERYKDELNKYKGELVRIQEQKTEEESQVRDVAAKRRECVRTKQCEIKRRFFQEMEIVLVSLSKDELFAMANNIYWNQIDYLICELKIRDACK